MKSTTRGCCLMGTLLALLVLASSMAVAADMPAAPKTSSYPPAPELGKQLEGFLKGLEAAVANEADYKDAQTRIPKDANTVLLVALALGMHDTDNDYKAAAPAMVEAAKKLMAAKDYKATKTAVEALKAAASSKGDPSKLSWKEAESASLPALMQQVPLVSAKLKRSVKQLKKKGEDATGQAAVIAVIGQGSMALSAQTQKPGEAEKWFKYCGEMRDACTEVIAGVKAQDDKAVEKAIATMTKSCDDCHEVFNPKANPAAANAK